MYEKTPHFTGFKVINSLQAKRPNPAIIGESGHDGSRNLVYLDYGLD